MQEVKPGDGIIKKYENVKDEDKDESSEQEEEESSEVEEDKSSEQEEEENCELVKRNWSMMYLSENEENETRARQLVVSKTLEYQHIYV